MKKLMAVIALFFIFASNACAAGVEVTHEGRSDLNIFERSPYIFGRGFLNIVTAPLELVTTFKTEPQKHPKAWPLYYPWRLFNNFFIRLSSGVADMLVLPYFVAPFSDDTRPFTRTFDLPDYAFQNEMTDE